MIDAFHATEKETKATADRETDEEAAAARSRTHSAHLAGELRCAKLAGIVNHEYKSRNILDLNFALHSPIAPALSNLAQ